MQREGSNGRRLSLAAIWASAIAAAGLLAAAPLPAKAAVPESFHGVVSQTPLLAADIDQLRKGRVGTMRFIINWSTVEPKRGSYDFSEVDRFMRATAEAGVQPLPFVYGVPGWADEDESIGGLIASSDGQAAWRELLVALTWRYGQGGYFWAVAGLPDEGVRIWQLGNEPNLYSFWGGEPSPSRYALLLGLGADAVHSVDPAAEIAMAGLPPGTRGPDGWEYLDDLLEIEGVGDTFDYIAPHPYSADFKGVRGKLDKFRRVLVKHGLGEKRMLVTEIGWMAGGPKKHPLRRSKRGQARILSQVYNRLAAGRDRWGVAAVLWFAWQDRAKQQGLCSFCSRSGLFESDGRPKPAWTAFKRSARALRR